MAQRITFCFALLLVGVTTGACSLISAFGDFEIEETDGDADSDSDSENPGVSGRVRV